jgi:DNA-binding CsgD family transcriptional regulator
MYSNYILKAQEMAVSQSSTNEVMRSFAETSFEKLRITSIRYFRVDVGNVIELIASYGEQFATFEDDKFVKRDQKLPVCDVINLGKELYFASPSELSDLYEETKLWKKLPKNLAMIPVQKAGMTLGCLSITMDKVLDKNEFIEVMETFRVLAYLLELIHGYEESRFKHDHDSCESVQWVKSLLTQGEENAKTILSDHQVREAVNLTERQLQIAALIASGATNSAIARQLCFSDSTIRYETVKLYERLRVKNRSQAASRIRELGIV